ncbi:hypothetical protein ACFVGN_28730 [Streptomyces sp. NPDC057757]|uniref:hypothetical protein n=1 Tax=Streptomyces sp. NPDC057757 TaxID=3346241 RepID=UPI0036842CAF
MAGTDDDSIAAGDDDALFVLTAVLLTPAKFPSVLGDDYPAACAELDLAPLADGYGLVIGQDGEGARWTVVIDDVSLVAVAIASWDCGMEHELSPDERTVVSALPGWPLAVAVAAPGVPAPHDPGPELTDRPPLRPPDTTVWGPAQRRLGADEIALQWATWREQIDDSDFVMPDGEAPTDAEASRDPAQGNEADRTDATSTDAAPAEAGTKVARTEAERTEVHTTENADTGADTEELTGIRRVMAEARSYVNAPPPLGRVRSSFATNDARTLRADGPGWSLVARTDDIAFVLLDEEPGEVLPVGRGPELPGLLEALDKIAVRPS